MSKRKINFFVGNINITGGVETVTQVLAKEFKNRGNDIVIHSLYSKASTNPSEHFTIRHYGLAIPDEANNIFSKIKRLIINGLILRHKIARSIENEISIFQGFYVATCLPFIRRKTEATFVCEHNTYDAPGTLSRAIRKFIYQHFNPNVVVLTEADKKRFSEIGVRSVIKIINPSPFPVLTEERSNVGQNLIALGRFTKQKRFDLMVKISTTPLSAHKDWKLIIQGQGEELELIQKAASTSEAHSQISILPAGNPDKLYREGAIFLMTSLFEGLPMTLIECMSFGIPVICFNCSPGLAEIVEDGVNGFLVPMDDHKSFIDKMSQLMENPRLRKIMGDNAKNTASKYSLSQVVLDWEKILK